ncbi:MAG: sensor histidine kinase [Ramlibacter sp.]
MPDSTLASGSNVVDPATNVFGAPLPTLLPATALIVLACQRATLPAVPVRIEAFVERMERMSRANTGRTCQGAADPRQEAGAMPKEPVQPQPRHPSAGRLQMTPETGPVGQLDADLEERIRVLTAEVKALTAEMTTFSRSVAHDLRAPLAAINGFGQILEKECGASVSPRGRHLLSRMLAAARQMDGMTEGLLALARVSPAPMRARPVDLGQIAAQLLERLSEQAPHRKVDVRVMPDLWCQADSALLSQALGHLLSNAWKFTGQRVDARIEVGSQPGAHGETIYSVRDNGAGFDMNYVSRLFVVFSRLHTTAEFEGTGIGLAIVKKVIDRHGGRIWAQSAPGQGATFSFTLQAAEGPAASDMRAPPALPGMEPP